LVNGGCCGGRVAARFKTAFAGYAKILIGGGIYTIMNSLPICYPLRGKIMLSTENTQSLSDFRHKAGETLDRLNQTGEAEILTVNGEARAVLLSPAAYDAMAREVSLARDLATIQLARKEFKEGKGKDVRAAFAELRAELLALKAKRDGAK
jgi:PHD/YefM family antitoxin component YafN of YafNO toxin-antitoxin module